MSPSRKDNFLLVGLGNPGEKYANTRHNIGFQVLQAFAKKNEWKWQKQKKVRSLVAEGEYNNKSIILSLPQTYMNESGEAVKKCLQSYKAAQSHLLVVVDDIYLPFGSLRMRNKGSHGGHNGLRNIQDVLQSVEYSRLRIGVGEPPMGKEKAEFVVENFSAEEKKMIPCILLSAIDAIENWIEKDRNSGDSTKVQVKQNRGE